MEGLEPTYAPSTERLHPDLAHWTKSSVLGSLGPRSSYAHLTGIYLGVTVRLGQDKRSHNFINNAVLNSTVGKRGL